MLSDCADLLELLPDNTPVEENYKFLYGLYLKQAMGLAITQSDSIILRSIAEQCDDEAGHTRFKAMNFLPWSDEANTRTDNPNIIPCERTSKNIGSLGFQVFPNPTASWLTIIFENAFSGNLQITDVNGKQIQQAVISEQKSMLVNIENFPSGTYFCTAISESGARELTPFFVIK